MEVVYADESIWLTQKMMGMLYDGNVRTPNEHLKKSLPTANYKKITDTYATAMGYDVTAQATKRLFATVQNKLHWAIHGQTAAGVVYTRADAEQPNMGLTTWKDAPLGKVQKFDVLVA